MHQNSRTLPRNQCRRPVPRLPTIYCGAGTIPQPRQQTLYQNVLQGSQTASQQNHTTPRPAETFIRYYSSSRQPNQHLKDNPHGYYHPRRRNPNHQATNRRHHHHSNHHQHRNTRNNHRQIHHRKRRHSHLQHQRKHLPRRPPTHHQTHVRLLPLCGTIRHHQHQQPRQPRQPIPGMTSEPNLHHSRHHPSRPMDLERRPMETLRRTRHATPTNRATTPRQQHCHHDRFAASHRRLHPHLPAIQTAKTFGTVGSIQGSLRV